MLLFTNGCSFTWGGGLDNNILDDNSTRLQSVWPHHLGNLIGADKIVNLSAGCGSNQRIVRTTFDWITSTPKEELQNVVAVIQWSDISRYEWYYGVEHQYENTPERWLRANINGVIPGTDDAKIKKDSSWDKINYTRFESYTDIEGIYKHITECEALDNIFRKFNVKYYFWHMTNIITVLPSRYKEYFLNNFSWLGSEEKCIDLAHIGYERINLDPHPSLTGHKQIAQGIFESIKNKI
jgi:hypothetical protein